MIVLEVLFLVVFWTWVAVAVLLLRNTILPRASLTLSAADLGLSSETVQFPASDGVPLQGWKIPADPAKPWILLCHGLGTNRADVLDIAAGLSRHSFNTFLFDFRGHGGSRGRVTSFGWLEQRDLEGALAYLGRQADVPDQPYGIYGVSMGGAVALMVAGRDERLQAVAVDSAYTNLEESLARHLTLLYPMMPRWPVVGFMAVTYRLRFGVWPREVSPRDSVQRLGSRSLLVIHGSADHRMPVEDTRHLVGQTSGPCELWVVDGAGHLGSFAVDPEGYLERLVHFFSAHLE